MSLEIHPDAAANFNARASALLARIRPRSPDPSEPREFSPDLFVSEEINTGDIKSTGTVDIAGTMLSHYFLEGPVEMGLEGEDYQKLVKLVESIQRTPAFSRTVSLRRLEDVTFDWFQDSRKLATGATLTDYIAATCSPEIREYEVAIPIAWLSVESPLPVGRAVLRPLTSDVLDGWFRAFPNDAPSEDDRRKFELGQLRRRSELQGFSAAFVSVRAEQIRAQEVGLEEASVAASLLRFFAAASLTVRVTSACVPLGQEKDSKFQAITFADGSLKQWLHSGTPLYPPAWSLSTAQINQLRAGSRLDAISRLYCEPKTELHQRIVSALLLFSRVSVAHELSDKLVLLFASLESLLLRNEQEPIQSSIADRLAWIVGKTFSERKDIVATTKKVYGLRSRFVHHAQAIDDVAILDKFLKFGWWGIWRIVSLADKYATVDMLLEKVDELKLR